MYAGNCAKDTRHFYDATVNDLEYSNFQQGVAWGSSHILHSA